MRSLKAGVIGLGVGEAHLRGYQAIEGVTVGQICDIDHERLQEISRLYDVPAVTTDWRDVVDNPDIDVVSICSYDNFHAEQLIAALNAGKHVMVEKPVVLHRAEAEKASRALSDSGRYITSNLILRRSPRFREIRDLVRAGAFGEIFHIEGDYLHQILWKIVTGWRGQMPFYCTVYGGGIHLIDLMRWIMDQEITEVAAMGTRLPTAGTSYRWEDTITALFRWESGATGKSTTCFAPSRTKFHSLNIYGRDRAFVNAMPDATLFTGDDEDKDVHRYDIPYPAIEKGDLLPDFIDAIRSDRKPLVNEIDIFRVMDVCFAVFEALESKRTVPVVRTL
jgi:predicted dehydrogenase